VISGLGAVLLALTCAWIGSGTTTSRRAQAIAVPLCVSVIPLTLLCVRERGYSTASITLVAMSMISAGAGALVLLRVRCDAAIMERALHLRVERPRLRRHPSTMALAAWTFWTVVFLASPLRYAGAMENNALDAAVADRVSIDPFAPLAQQRPLDVGQCMNETEPQDVNAVLPCTAPHRSQVVAEVGPEDACPDLVEFSTGGLDVEMGRTDSGADSVDFCFIYLRNAVDIRLHQSIRQLDELADTP
jgi:hypothetical protein